ncbi:hypothetical protein J3E69DRAFT_10819 [Trichoderma sp. SZMC 28015]
MCLWDCLQAPPAPQISSRLDCLSFLLSRHSHAAFLLSMPQNSSNKLPLLALHALHALLPPHPSICMASFLPLPCSSSSRLVEPLFSPSLSLCLPTTLDCPHPWLANRPWLLEPVRSRASEAPGQPLCIDQGRSVRQKGCRGTNHGFAAPPLEEHGRC